MLRVLGGIIEFAVLQAMVDDSQQHACNCDHSAFVTTSVLDSLITTPKVLTCFVLNGGKRALDK